MNKLSRLTLLCIVGVLMLGLSQGAFSAPQVLLKLFATDSTRTDSLILGLDPLATNHIDTSLGEIEYPPGGPPFTLFFASNPGPVGKDTCGTGTKINYHFMATPTQNDRWRVAFWSDDSGTTVTFTWQIVLAGGNGWKLEDGSPDPITLHTHFDPIDMTSATSLTYPVKTTQADGAQYIYIDYGDALAYRTATVDEIRTSFDQKGKFSAVKLKPDKAIFTINLTAPAAGGAQTLNLDFGALTTGTASSGAETYSFTAIKKPVISFTSLAPSAPVVVSGIAAVGKIPKVKFFWGTDKAAPVPPFACQLGDPMPNWQNVGQEMLPKVPTYFPDMLTTGKTAGLWVGSLASVGVDAKLKPIYKFVYHQKWQDVQKTLDKKGTPHTGAPHCLNVDLKLKPIVKGVKSAPPDKFNNMLIPAAVVLKFNQALNRAGDKVRGATGFGSLLYSPLPADPPEVQGAVSVDSIIRLTDQYLTCRGTLTDSAGLLAVIQRINAAFTGPFDTVSWALNGGKFGNTVLTPVRALGDQNVLYRTSLVMPPVAPLLPFNAGQTPETFKLDQNYPNPFNPTTTISFTLPEDGIVSLTIYNVLGQQVATVLNHEEMTSGDNEVSFDASQLSSGVYFYRLVVNNGQFQQVKKMMLLK